MNKNMKKIIMSIFALAFLFVGTSAFAYVSWNTDATDCQGSNIGNFSTGAGIPPVGSNDCWSLTNVSATGGQTINVEQYYHNTGNEPATNAVVYISVSPAIGTASTTHTFTSSLTANPTGTSLGSTTLTLATPQALSFGSTYWYPNQTSNPTIINNPQIISGNGLSIGTVVSGWSGQGSTVTSFLVGNTQQPTCKINSFTANPTTIALGGNSTLTWSISNCNSAMITSSNNSFNYNVPSYNLTNGSTSVTPPGTTTYTITGYGANGSTHTKTATVTVNTPIPNCVINNFTANPNQISQGGSSTLSWNTTDCNSVTISNLGYNVPVDGSQVVYPTATTTYVLTAYGQNGGPQTQSVTVTVNTPILNCVINSFSASPTQITSGGSSTLSWSTTDCTSVSISPNIGNVSASGSRIVYPTQTTTYTITGYGANNSGDTKSVTVTVNTQIPNCVINSFTANPTTITSGGSSTLSWNTTGCTSVNISNLNYNVPVDGSQVVYPVHTTTYTLTAYGENGSPITLSRTVTVSNPQICSVSSFYANPNTINQGGTSTLTWNSSNCTSVTISPNVGNVNLSGSYVVSPTQTTTYTLTAYGTSGAQQTRFETVTVSSNSTCAITNFNASPNSINTGGSSTLNWNTTNCTSVSISNLNYNVPVSGSQVVYPTYTTTYVLTAYGQNGGQQTQSVTVTVNNYQNSCYISYFNASPTYISTGGSSVLSWNTTNCTSVSISNLNYNVPTSGTQVVYPTYTTTYVLTAYGQNGGTQTQSVTVSANGYQNNCLISYFSASPTSINSGGSSTLSWSTSNCTSVNISNLNYNVPISGTQIIYPSYTTNYTLTAYGQNGGQQVASTSVYVNAYIPPVITSCAVSTIPTNVNQNSATLNGMLTGGGNYNSYFEYGNTVNLGSQTPARYSNGSTIFSDIIGGLSTETVYYFRLVSNCSNGSIARGDIKVFQTLASNVRPVIIQGTTIVGTNSPIELKIENRFSSIRNGDTINYIVTYKNVGSKKLTRPIVQVIIPDGITFLNSSRGTYSQNTNTLNAPIEDLNPGDGGTIYIEGRVDSIKSNNREVVTTAILIYTNSKGTQENAMAYVLNNSTDSGNSLGALAFFSGFFGIGLLGWLLIIIIILLIILIYRRYFYQKPFTNVATTSRTTETETHSTH
jgi:hypothetical protein